jgi:hypothetical protein
MGREGLAGRSGPGTAGTGTGDGGDGTGTGTAGTGRSWTTCPVFGTSGGVTLNSLQFMSPTVGCLVAGNPATGSHGALLWTNNLGLSWYPVRF